jgi:Putative Ig domain
MLPFRHPIALCFCVVVLLGAASTSRAISLSGTPANALNVGAAYYFQPRVANANLSKVEFAVKNLPAWASLARKSGVISGTANQAGVWQNIVVEVWDGAHYAEMPPFAISVGPSASARTLKMTGTPAVTAEIGQYYSFSPTVVASGGSNLTYAISNKPAWANFSTSTGLLSGTPTTANAGVTRNVALSVSNGSTSVALPAFSLSAVQPAATASASVKWSKPTLNADGTPLRNLAGYVIRYGRSKAALDKLLPIHYANTTEAVIDSLTSGTWYFQVAAVNAAGGQGSFTGIIDAKL